MAVVRVLIWVLGCACAALSLDIGIAWGLGRWSVLAGFGGLAAGIFSGYLVVSLIDGRRRRLAVCVLLTGVLIGLFVWLTRWQQKTRTELSAGTLTVNTVRWFHDVLGCAIRNPSLPEEVVRDIWYIVLHFNAFPSVSDGGEWYSADAVLDSGPGDKTGPYLQWSYVEAPANMQWGPVLLRVLLYPDKTHGLSTDSLVWRGCTVDLVRPGSYPSDNPTEDARMRKKTEALVQAVRLVVKETSVDRNPAERARKRQPLVTGLVEFPDGTRTNRIRSVCMLEETAEGQGSMSGTISGAVGGPGPIELDTYASPFQNAVWRRVLSFSNLVSAPVTITFTNGMPDRTNVVFKMQKVM